MHPQHVWVEHRAALAPPQGFTCQARPRKLNLRKIKDIENVRLKRYTSLLRNLLQPTASTRGCMMPLLLYGKS